MATDGSGYKTLSNSDESLDRNFEHYAQVPIPCNIGYTNLNQYAQFDETIYKQMTNQEEPSVSRTQAETTTREDSKTSTERPLRKMVFSRYNSTQIAQAEMQL